jgi:hypothetical protein
VSSGGSRQGWLWLRDSAEKRRCQGEAVGEGGGCRGCKDQTLTGSSLLAASSFAATKLSLMGMQLFGGSPSSSGPCRMRQPPLPFLKTGKAPHGSPPAPLSTQKRVHSVPLFTKWPGSSRHTLAARPALRTGASGAVAGTAQGRKSTRRGRARRGGTWGRTCRTLTSGTRRRSRALSAGPTSIRGRRVDALRGGGG